MAAAEKHDSLETAQLVVAIATGLIGLLYYQHRKAGAAEEERLPAPAGPQGFGEVAGYGGGGGGGGLVSPVSGAPAPPKAGEQTLSSGGEQPAPTGGNVGPGPGKLVPKSSGPNPGGPTPGQSQAEWERERLQWRTTHAQPGVQRAQARQLGGGFGGASLGVIAPPRAAGPGGGFGRRAREAVPA